ncbi:TMV resistance protein N-like [Pyrus ussuriensis x Pyrus communis]|uniref:TMV resistance protein N-like n=1 Tax=Pyrus ussuriensis x Pyrus communis TaxID=2448454 RepID=A0A5N5GBD3_9ROSA|nr:TMV resistance protein N-like [Pyrus ussuriensis x Pyrus communis]
MATGPQATKKPTFASREEPLGAEMYWKDKPFLDTIIEELEGPGEGSGQSPSPLVCKVAFSRPSLASRKQAKTTATSTPQASLFPETTLTVATSEVVREMPPHFPPISATSSLLELFKEFGQLKTKLRCFKEKQTRTSTHIHKLVDEGLATEDTIKVVTSEIQKLEEQLAVLKAEQTTLLSKLHQQIEEVKKENLELKDAESQLTNSSTVLAEIITLGEEVNL